MREASRETWTLLASSIGNIYEWYDFAVYGYLASEIGTNFFPDTNDTAAILESFAVFGAAFMMRPVGAVFFGNHGDKLGRRSALIHSIVMMAVPSILMGLLPVYENIKLAATSMLLILRLAQGFSVGGQLAGSYLMVAESSSQNDTGFQLSITNACGILGFAMGSGIVSMLRGTLSDDAMLLYGWRIPFLLGACFLPVGFTLARNTTETDDFVALKQAKSIEAEPLVTLMSGKALRNRLLLMIGTIAFPGASFYYMYTWMATYTGDLADTMSGSKADTVTFSCLIVGMFSSVAFGWLSDRVGRIKIMMFAFVSLIIYLPICQYAVLHGNLAVSVLAQVVASILVGAHGGVSPSWEVELWPEEPSIRYSAVAIGHNISLAVFGGTIASIATGIYALDHGAVWSAVYCSCIGVLSVACLHHTRDFWDALGRPKMKRKQSGIDIKGEEGERAPLMAEAKLP